MPLKWKYSPDGSQLLRAKKSQPSPALAPVNGSAPSDWEVFRKWFMENRPFRPRSWEYHKAPRWLTGREYKDWKAQNAGDKI